MAVSDGRIIDAAKAYSRRLDGGQNEVEARQYLEYNFPGFSDAQIDEAVYEAQRGRDVAAYLNTIRLKMARRLDEACGPDDDCSGDVGVRILVKRIRGDGTEDFYTLYLPMNWQATMGDVGAMVNDFLEYGPKRGYDTHKFTYSFQGPTRWPGKSPNLGERLE